jgi:hypothetical protein
MIAVTWMDRPVPLAPVAVIASGDASRRLAASLLRRDDAALSSLRGVAGTGVLLVLGEIDALPWADGALYLGRDPEAPALLIPTTSMPGCPPALLERAIGRRYPNETPIAVVPDEGILVGASAARPVARARLKAWLEGGT